MNIQAISSRLMDRITDRIPQFISHLDQKVLLIASFVFACIAAIYICKYWRASAALEALKGALFTGHATFINPAGDRIEGEFVKGMMHGPGEVIFKSGEIWKGDFQKNQLHGLGKKTYTDGTEEEGRFKAGKLIALVKEE